MIISGKTSFSTNELWMESWLESISIANVSHQPVSSSMFSVQSAWPHRLSGMHSPHHILKIHMSSQMHICAALIISAFSLLKKKKTVKKRPSVIWCKGSGWDILRSEVMKHQVTASRSVLCFHVRFNFVYTNLCERAFKSVNGLHLPHLLRFHSQIGICQLLNRSHNPGDWFNFSSLFGNSLKLYL